MRKCIIYFAIILVGIALLMGSLAGADDNSNNAVANAATNPENINHNETTQEGGISTAIVFLWIAILLILARVSSLIERWGQPAVLGELIIGIILGNLVFLNITVFEALKTNPYIKFLAELGVVILLFQVGLESNLNDMKRVGIRATIVAVVGVVVPFILGTAIVGPLLMPGLSQNAYLFLGAALTATSVGITARVFRDLGTVDTDEAKIVLGAAVIDDVIGLVILAVVSGIATLGAVSLGMISWILAKSVLFLVGAIIFGRLCAPYISKLFSKIHTGVGMKFTIVISFGLVFAFLSQLIGLAPIVGAFAAGLILEAVQFKYFKDPHVVEDLNEHLQTCRPGCKQRMEAIIAKHSNRHIIDFVEPLGLFLVPLFFIMTGAGVNLSVLFDLKVVLLALGIIVAAFLGKIVTGLVAGKGRDKWIVGWGMVPRGEVGLIFAAMGKSLNVINDTVYSVIVIVVMVSTLVPPVVLTYLINKNKKKKN